MPRRAQRDQPTKGRRGSPLSDPPSSPHTYRVLSPPLSLLSTLVTSRQLIRRQIRPGTKFVPILAPLFPVRETEETLRVAVPARKWAVDGVRHCPAQVPTSLMRAASNSTAARCNLPTPTARVQRRGAGFSTTERPALQQISSTFALVLIASPTREPSTALPFRPTPLLMLQ